MGSNGDGGRFHDNGYMDFGKADLILEKEFTQNRTNGLRLPSIFAFLVLVLELADAVFHVVILQNTIRL